MEEYAVETRLVDLAGDAFGDLRELERDGTPAKSDEGRFLCFSISGDCEPNVPYLIDGGSLLKGLFEVGRALWCLDRLSAAFFGEGSLDGLDVVLEARARRLRRSLESRLGGAVFVESAAGAGAASFDRRASDVLSDPVDDDCASLAPFGPFVFEVPFT